jgi:AraC-like DNA-binding protein
MTERIQASSATDVEMCGSYVLRARSRRYHWQGTQPLSIKAFFGGEALYSAGGGYHAVGGASYLVLNAGQHYTISIEAPQPVESFCIFFAPGLAADVRRSLTCKSTPLLDDPAADHAMQADTAFYERVYSADDEVWPALLRLRAGMAAPAGDDAAWLEERLHELMAALWRERGRLRAEVEVLPAARPATREELYCRLHLARDYAAAMYATPVTLDVLARVACMSPNHLLRTFSAAFGQTPHQYLTAVRMERAAALLHANGLSVTEIGRAVGYASLGSFSALFKRQTGMSPQEYRQAIR